MVLRNDICVVSISIDGTYTVDSMDNKPYDIVISPKNYKHNDIYKTLSIQIDLFYNMMSIALVGDFYSYDTDCAVLDGEILTVLQNDAIIQINVIDGSLMLYKMFECFGCNFGIYRVSQGYIIYGEIEVIMLDFGFNRKWSFSGKDIFVSTTQKKPFEISNNSIKLYDFEDNFYEIDFNGNLIKSVIT